MYRSGVNVQNPGNAGYKIMVGRFCGRSRARYWELDFARGLCVVLMIFDHLMYCLWDLMPAINELFGTTLFVQSRALAIAYWNWDVRVNVRICVITAFFLLCGISSTLTRGHFRRCIPLAVVAAGITAVTALLEEIGMGQEVLFGVIHMLACGIFLYAVLDNAAICVGELLGQGKRARFFREALRYLPGLVGLGMLVWLFSCGADFVWKDGVWTLESHIASLPTVEENRWLSVFVYVRGFDFTKYSGDYFPLLPFAAIVLSGGIIGRLIYHTSARYAFAPFDGAWNRGVCFFGRHAAVIYIAHMVVIPVLLALAALVSGFLG